ncbi:hypothetical protein WN48_08421 [Eufriesea mexicana]|uniref:Uncharacterized protein n=1 Tax=Eufriesea mexicana TaxID=516756 RepID=A0A310SG04_9HYME|nr:hypothetical protein WN48_08421 [Eufriesea mexicana]
MLGRPRPREEMPRVTGRHEQGKEPYAYFIPNLFPQDRRPTYASRMADAQPRNAVQRVPPTKTRRDLVTRNQERVPKQTVSGVGYIKHSPPPLTGDAYEHCVARRTSTKRRVETRNGSIGFNGTPIETFDRLRTYENLSPTLPVGPNEQMTVNKLVLLFREPLGVNEKTRKAPLEERSNNDHAKWIAFDGDGGDSTRNLRRGRTSYSFGQRLAL